MDEEFDYEMQYSIVAKMKYDCGETYDLYESNFIGTEHFLKYTPTMRFCFPLCLYQQVIKNILNDVMMFYGEAKEYNFNLTFDYIEQAYNIFSNLKDGHRQNIIKFHCDSLPPYKQQAKILPKKEQVNDTCGVCFEDMNCFFKLKNCNHHLCTSCFESMLEKVAFSEKEFVCPFCRSPMHGTSMEDCYKQ